MTKYQSACRRAGKQININIQNLTDQTVFNIVLLVIGLPVGGLFGILEIWLLVIY